MANRRKSQKYAKDNFEDLIKPDSDGPSPRSKRRRTGNGEATSKHEERKETAQHTSLPVDNETSSQHILEAFQRTRNQKRGEFVSKLKAKQATQRQEIESIIANTEKQLQEDDTKFVKEIADEIRDVLKREPWAEQDSDQGASDGTITSKHGFQQRLSTSIKQSKDLIEKYNQASMLVQKAKPERILGETWEADRKALIELLEADHKATKQDMKRRISRDAVAAPSGDDQSENRIASRFWGRYTPKEGEGIGALKILAQTEKGMKEAMASFSKHQD